MNDNGNRRYLWGIIFVSVFIVFWILFAIVSEIGRDHEKFAQLSAKNKMLYIIKVFTRPTRTEFDSLETKIEKLEKRIVELESKG